MAIHFVFKGIDELRTGKKTAYRGQYSFDMNGNEVSCISDFYDIENLAAIEDARFYNEPTFYKVEVGGNQSVYVSTGNIRQSQFAEIVNQPSGDISIVSGMHGGPDGTLLSEYNGVSGKQLISRHYLSATTPVVYERKQYIGVGVNEGEILRINTVKEVDKQFFHSKQLSR